MISPKQKPQVVATSRNLAIDPRRRNERIRVLNLAKNGLPSVVVAQKANVPESRVRSIIAGQLEFADRLPARVRMVLAHELMMAADRIITDCEVECISELEVA